MSGPGRITKLLLGISRQDAVAYRLRVTPQTTDEIRSVAHRMGVIGKVERKWAFFRARNRRLIWPDFVKCPTTHSHDPVRTVCR